MRCGRRLPVTDQRCRAPDYKRDKKAGSKTGARYAQQTLRARYRIRHDSALRLIADAPDRAPVRNARMFALLAMVGDDVGVATGEAKLHYNFWRPITAIRNASDDGNADTAEDSNWEPLIATPNHPEYPCAHCSFSAATAAV